MALNITAAPEWIQQFLTETLTENGEPITVSAVRMSYDNTPSSLIAATRRGVGYVNFVEDGDPSVYLYGWPEIRAVRLFRAMVSLAVDVPRGPVSVDFDDEASARQFAIGLQEARVPSLRPTN